MRFIYPLFGLILFVLLLGFAIKNVEPVELHYYLGTVWRAPLSLMLLIAFFMGTLAGLIICVTPLIKQRRHVLALQRELKALQSTLHS